jgi:2,6-dihydroxypyridine 3-monooxygenase
MTEKDVTEMRETARRWLAPPIAEVVTAVTEPFAQAVIDIDTPAMSGERVCLLGDAAFAVRPHAAAGTAKAAEDAWQLAAHLNEHPTDIPTAIRAWEKTQHALGRDLLWRCRTIGDRSQLHNSWDPTDPALIFGLHAPGD